MKVVFRVDASSQIGTGHVMRCLSLAEEFKQKAASCIFICRGFDGNLLQTIKDRGFETIELSEACKNNEENVKPFNHSSWLGVSQLEDFKQTSIHLEKSRPELLVIDHYAIDEIWERLARKYVKKILVIDDLADRRHDCDILLDQNWFAEETDFRYDHLVSNNTIKLLGPKYALLKPEYALLRSILPPRDGIVKRLLVFMGGSDATNETGKVLEALNDEAFKSLAVDVVIGINHPFPEKIQNQVDERENTTLYQNLQSLAGLMFRADLMIGAGGSTTWERMCLGLPAIVISVAENQIPINEALSRKGYINYIGNLPNVEATEIKGILKAINTKSNLLKEQSKKLLDYCITGDGSRKILNTIFR